LEGGGLGPLYRWKEKGKREKKRRGENSHFLKIRSGQILSSRSLETEKKDWGDRAGRNEVGLKERGGGGVKQKGRRFNHLEEKDAC